MADAPTQEGLSAKDEKDLRILSILHYCLGAITALCAAFGIPFVTLGTQLMRSGGRRAKVPAEYQDLIQLLKDIPGFGDPALLGQMILVIGAGIIALCLVHGFVTAGVGWWIAKRRHRVLSIVFEAFNLMDLPLGTILGIFAIIVLSRPSVVREFEMKAKGHSVPPPASEKT